MVRQHAMSRRQPSGISRHGPSGISRRAFLLGGAAFTSALLSGGGEAAPPRSGKIGFTVSSPQGDGRNFWADLSRIQDLGASWIRFSIDFNDVFDGWDATKRIVWDSRVLSLYDRAFDAVEKAGLSVCFLTVSGITGLNDDDYLDVMETYWNGIAHRYGDRTRVWQVFNEANGVDFMDASSIPRDGYGRYLNRLRTALGVARRAIHARSPGVLVTTNAGGFPVDDAMEAGWVRFFDGISDQLDLLSVDPYPQFHAQKIASIPGRLKRVSRRFHKPIAVAEFGLQTGPGLYTQAQQTSALTGMLETLTTSVIEHAMVYRLRDDGAAGDDGFGIYEIDGTPKASVGPVTKAIARHYPHG